jgi:hypothetical protein
VKPGDNFMPVVPTSITTPAGWTFSVTSGGPSGGSAIRWEAGGAANDLTAGNSWEGSVSEALYRRYRWKPQQSVARGSQLIVSSSRWASHSQMPALTFRRVLSRSRLICTVPNLLVISRVGKPPARFWLLKGQTSDGFVLRVFAK